MPAPGGSLCTSHRPGLSQGAQAIEVNLGVDFRCVGNPMPENFSDFSHRRSRAKHGSSQTVAKQVSSLEGGV